ncbi:hypothetical protein A9B99_22440 [Mangrovibacter phragmitis]|uniref:DUF4123 domain-containing protein n=1 Tax=Mangrovibacter phragmitis TaxID=1691903 RepID=A0A1B7L340_9ENTR|nr:DUF4123 domain-containing protein [Mangrovibacter phragmitis]OAT76799.1 hypothetical protein A9B99_22440 [Mangrovibacter phragmitis]
MDTTALLAALPTRAEENICLLFEAGAQPEADFLAFKKQHDHRLHSLYIHPQLTELQHYGPWLLEVDNEEQLNTYLHALPGCVAVIISTCYPSSLAVQLSRGCTILPPESTAVLVRFYASHVIAVLATHKKCDWHAYLFNGITQWWLPGETQWQRLSIAVSEIENPRNHVIRLDKTTWQQIAEKPEVATLLSKWQEMPASRVFPPCTQRLMVIKALNKAGKMGLEQPADRMLYALFYLDGGRNQLESDALKAELPSVVSGMKPLFDVLARYTAP